MVQEAAIQQTEQKKLNITGDQESFDALSKQLHDLKKDPSVYKEVMKEISEAYAENLKAGNNTIHVAEIQKVLQNSEGFREHEEKERKLAKDLDKNKSPEADNKSFEEQIDMRNALKMKMQAQDVSMNLVGNLAPSVARNVEADINQNLSRA